MIDFVGYWPISIVIVLILATAARLRLQQGAQPLRMELADKGERLLADQSIPPVLRSHVKDMLDTAFGCRWTLLFGLLLVPFLAVVTVVAPERLVTFWDRLNAAINSLNPEQRALYHELSRLHDRVTLANHPIILPVLEFEIVVLMPLGILLLSLTRGRVPLKGDRDAVVTYIEMKKSRESAAVA